MAISERRSCFDSLCADAEIDGRAIVALASGEVKVYNQDFEEEVGSNGSCNYVAMLMPCIEQLSFKAHMTVNAMHWDPESNKLAVGGKVGCDMACHSSHVAALLMSRTGTCPTV